MAETNWTNMTDFADILMEANNQTGGWFWTGINFMVFLVLLITMTGIAGWEAGFLTAGFVAIVTSIFLTYLGLQAWWITGMIVGVIIIINIYLMWRNKYD